MHNNSCKIKDSLKYFISKFVLRGWWKPMERQLNIKGDFNALKLIAWLGAVIMGYATLFFIGAIILSPWTNALIYAAAFIIGLTLFLKFFKKKGIDRIAIPFFKKK